MLTLEPPFWTIDGIAVFRDHEVPTQYYYGAPNPAIASTGDRPMFDLFAYLVDLKQSALGGTTIPDQLGAGFLTMGVECAVTDAQRSHIAAQVAGVAGVDPSTVSLFPIPYHRGSVSVIALDKMSAPTAPDGSAPPVDPARPTDGRPTFVEAILGSATPNLLGNLRSVFSLSLSQSGVTFLEGLYEDGAAPVGIVYDLAFYGLRPAVSARITADISNIYTHFGGDLAVQVYYVRADIDAALDKLEQDGVIKVEITSQATGEEAQRSKELAMSLFRDQIVQQLFRPTTPAPVGGTTTAGLAQALRQSGSAPVSLTLQAKHTEELKTVTYDFNERAPEERRHAPQAFLPLLVTPDQVAHAIHRIDLNDPFFDVLDVLVTGPTPEDFTTLGIRQVEATLSYGTAGDAVAPVTNTLVFRHDATGDRHFAAPRAGRASLDYTLGLGYDLERSVGVAGDAFSYSVPARPQTSRAILVNPTADFGFRDVELELHRPPDMLAEAEVTLSYAAADGSFATSQTFHLPAAGGQPNPHWRVRTRETVLAPYHIAAVWRFADGAVWVAPAATGTDPLLTLDSPFAHTRSLLIRPNVTSAAISAVTVEVTYEDALHAYQRSFVVNLAPPFATQTLAWPVLDAAAQRVRYRVTTTEPGFVSQGDWQETDETSVVVGSAGARVAKIDIHVIGPSLAEQSLDAVRIDLQVDPTTGAEGETASLLLDDTARSATANLTYSPGAALAYDYRTTAYRVDGTTNVSGWIAQSNPLLVISTRSL